ncbi:MAG: SseB family protein [Elusimicrobia bacterium]|nr:SseB family protein [Elusimicrobiota bacterium]
MGRLEEALAAAGEGEERMFAFFALFLASKFVVPARPGTGSEGPRPVLFSFDGRPAALAYGSRDAARDEAPGGAVLAELRGDDLVLSLESNPAARLVLVIDSGESRPFPPDMVALMRETARLAQKEMGGRPGSRADGRPDALVRALKEALARSLEAASAAFAAGEGFRVVVTMHKGQDAAFKYVRGDILRAAEEAGFELAVFASTDPEAPAPEPAPFYRTS